MEKFCDLHTHSLFSDGSCRPSEIIELAEKSGLTAVALSDHNTTDGLLEFLKAAKGSSVLAIPGAEFSVDFNGTELHLLGLFLPEKSFSQISEIMEAAKKRKENSNIELIKALKTININLDYETIKSKTPTGYVNRVHIAEEMVSLGYISSITEGFATHLSKKTGFYKEPNRTSVYEMTDIIRSLGGAPILAHPLLNLSENEFTDFLPSAKSAGLLGFECYYSSYSQEQTDFSLSLIKEFGLLPSGGSDFHGFKKPDINLGTGKGNLKIPFDWALAIKNSIN